MPGLLKSLFGGPPPALDEEAWHDALAQPVFDGLDDDERARLRDLARQILADKDFSGAGGAEVDDYMRTAIAAFAALPVLNLDADAYAGWREIVIYPAEFIHEGHETDEIGVVHHVRHVRSGEAMYGGPLVLSWDDVAASGGGEGYNVVIHEFAHKLDMRNGAVDGLPPLPAGMRVAEWSAAFSAAYEDFTRRVERGEETAIDPYAAENPAEFFAVLTECFFEWPEAVREAYPAVYDQLARFYRQDPFKRLENRPHDPATP